MFTLRVATMPTLPQILELERIIVIDQTGPVLPVGVSPGKACLVAEFLKGPFKPKEVVSGGDILSTYVGNLLWLDRISQSGINPAGVGWAQDGSGGEWDGNGWMELKGKRFRSLVLQRVDCDMQTTVGGVKGFLKFAVTIGTPDQTSSKTNKDIYIPAGTRFADVALGTETNIVALSQDLLIPKGTAVTANQVVISSLAAAGVHSCKQDEDTGLLTVQLKPDGTGTPYIGASGQIGPTAFFVKGKDATGGVKIDVPIDVAIPGVDATTVIAVGTVSTVDASGLASDVYAACTGAAPGVDNLANRIYTRYAEAVDKTLPGRDETNNITDIWAARNWATNLGGAAPQDTVLRKKLWENAVNSSRSGRGRRAYVCSHPAISVGSTDRTAAIADVKKLYAGATGTAEFTGVDADRVCISFPFAMVFSSEYNRAINISACGSRVCMRNNLPEEYQTSVGTSENASIQDLLQLEAAFAANPLVESDFVALKAAGVGVLVKDRPNGWWFYSGVTAVDPGTQSTRVADNRRAFADFVQDTLIQIASVYSKKPGTTERMDAITGEIESFMESLLSPHNKSLQRIEAYLVDPKSGNQPNMTALGIRIIIVKCRMLGDLNDIIFNTEIGPTVTITQAA